jgi:hypothetical protein
MVHFDPYEATRTKTKKRKGNYPKIPISKRLNNWFETIVEKSAFMRTNTSETKLYLRKNHATELGLKTSEATIEVKETTVLLFSPWQKEPLVTIAKS